MNFAENIGNLRSYQNLHNSSQNNCVLSAAWSEFITTLLAQECPDSILITAFNLSREDFALMNCCTNPDIQIDLNFKQAAI